MKKKKIKNFSKGKLVFQSFGIIGCVAIMFYLVPNANAKDLVRSMKAKAKSSITDVQTIESMNEKIQIIL
jgi:hypothetical protein